MKEMPNLTGVSAMPFFSTGLVGVELGDRLPPRPVVAGPLELGDELGQDVVLDPHAVGRAVAPGAAVEIGLAHIERIAPGRIGDVVHHPLGEEHALRAAEAAEGGVGDGVGPHAPRDGCGTAG